MKTKEDSFSLVEIVTLFSTFPMNFKKENKDRFFTLGDRQ
jgi:hypothetical protein